MNEDYAQTVQLLLSVAPVVFETPVFAMKGGTALNFFVHNMPRLSVDIDVVFVPHTPSRDEALQAIGEALAVARHRLERSGLQVSLHRAKDGSEAKLFVSNGTHQIKIEVNFVFRGTVLPPKSMPLSAAAQAAFSINVDVPVLATPELYGSKLVAALDRQHPRDLFDVQLMLSRFGLPGDFLDCFVVYLAGHDRPVHEVLFPGERHIDTIFEAEFTGMTTVPVTLDELKATRSRLLAELPRALSTAQRDFLLSIVKAEPDWRLLPFAHIERLPAIRWKLMNLKKLKRNAVKFRRQYDALLAGFAS